jgi:hypothetical protein
LFGRVDVGSAAACSASPGKVVTPMPAATRACTTTMSSLADAMRGVNPSCDRRAAEGASGLP